MTNSSTIATLTALLDRAKRGEINGVAVFYCRSDGFLSSAFTGEYATDPAQGVNAAMQWAWELTQAQDILPA